jgi:hypothetical protein
MPAQPKNILVFIGKFTVIAPLTLALWWTIIPQYAWFLGQLAGFTLTHLVGMPIDALKVVTEESAVLNTDTSIEFMYRDQRFPFHIASIVNNLPPFLVLVLASPGIGWRRMTRAIAIGLPVLIAGQVFFVVYAFRFAIQISENPQVPTAFGLFLMTLPFMLWIVLVYWEKVSEYLNALDGDKES